jgi:hypothetical protein
LEREGESERGKERDGEREGEGGRWREREGEGGKQGRRRREQMNEQRRERRRGKRSLIYIYIHLLYLCRIHMQMFNSLSHKKPANNFLDLYDSLVIHFIESRNIYIYNYI